MYKMLCLIKQVVRFACCCVHSLEQGCGVMFSRNFNNQPCLTSAPVSVMIYTGGPRRQYTAVGQCYYVGEAQKKQVGTLKDFLRIISAIHP